MKIFWVITEGKFKQNIVAANDLDEALKLIRVAYPNFANAKMTGAEVTTPRILC